MQLCEDENQTLEAFGAVSRLCTKSDCPVARQKFLPLATAHDCEPGLIGELKCALDLFKNVFLKSLTYKNRTIYLSAVGEMSGLTMNHDKNRPHNRNSG